MMSSNPFTAARRRMIHQQLLRRGIRDRRVLAAMEAIPREQFMEADDPETIYGDHAFGIGCEQTISQPYMVALMSESLALEGSERVLEIGTGSGYQTAILAKLASEVFTVERHPQLQEMARRRLDALGMANVHYRPGDGSLGWPESAPFDRVIVTAGAENCPPALLEQLADSGVLVGPFGGTSQQTLQRRRKVGDQIITANLTPCRFVPLVDLATERTPKE